MYILVCNAGSTSLKFKVFDMPKESVLASSKIECIGSSGKGIFTYKNHIGTEIRKKNIDIPTYTDGIILFWKYLLNDDDEVGVLNSIDEIERIGFKTVLAPGYSVALLDDKVEARMQEFLDVAPAHNGRLV